MIIKAYSGAKRFKRIKTIKIRLRLFFPLLEGLKTKPKHHPAIVLLHTKQHWYFTHNYKSNRLRSLSLVKNLSNCLSIRSFASWFSSANFIIHAPIKILRLVSSQCGIALGDTVKNQKEIKWLYIIAQQNQ